MLKQSHKIGTVTQNVIIGSVTGIMVGINLRFIFMQLGGIEWVWLAFFILGPALGYFSGRERQRIESLKGEKQELESNLDSIQKALKQSTKKYRLLVEQANDAIFLTSSEGRFMLFNEATCRLSGYGKSELKKMQIANLKPDGDTIDENADAWLDNGTYRYEETWTQKNGNTIMLEINARWIQFSDHRLVLHIGRDIQRQKEVGNEERATQYQEAQEYHIRESARFNEKLFHQFLDPMYETVRVLKHLNNKYPQEAGALTELLKVWATTQKNILELSVKNDRDKSTIPANWNLNDLLHQELVYLDMMNDSSNFRIKTSFSQDLSMVYGFGRDYSLAFSVVFRALCETQPVDKQRGLLVSTKQIKDQIIVELLGPGDNTFKQVLHRVLDPFHEGNRGIRMPVDDFAQFVLEQLFKVFDGQVDIGYKAGKGTLLRIRIPTVQNNNNRKTISMAFDTKEPVLL
ncbi:PAS domain S-box protein [bacterium]|nr:PAS domain S-box protein [bacterium]